MRGVFEEGDDLAVHRVVLSYFAHSVIVEQREQVLVTETALRLQCLDDFFELLARRHYQLLHEHEVASGLVPQHGIIAVLVFAVDGILVQEATRGLGFHMKGR